MALARKRRQEFTLQLGAGYFDESTDDGDSFCYVVAGFVGSQHATVILDLRWKDILIEYGLDYFKASELSAGEGQFKKYRDDPAATEWKPFSAREKAKFTEIKKRFTDVIVSCRGLYGIGAALILPDLDRLRKEYPRADAALEHVPDLVESSGSRWAAL